MPTKITLHEANHYHHLKPSQPKPIKIPKGFERVEVVTGGRCWISIDEKWVELSAGDILWHYSGDKTIGRNDPKNPYRCLNVIFKCSGNEDQKILRLTHWPNLSEILSFTNEIITHWLDPNFPKEELSRYAYHLLRYKAVQHEKEQIKDQMPSPIKKVLRYLETSYPEPIRLKKLAEIAQCSIPYLHELFQIHCQKSPYATLIEIRIREACRRLSSSDEPIKKIALETGFNQPSAFSHSFKSQIGKTPASYRKQTRNPF